MRIVNGILLLSIGSVGTLNDQNEKLMLSLPRSLISPPLAPSFEKLQSLIDDVDKYRTESANASEAEQDANLLPCLLRGGGCNKEDSSGAQPNNTKQDSHTGDQLRKTQASIEKAVTKLQQDLDVKTAEVVKEIERRAAEMRKEIAKEADEVIEAVKYLVTLLSDSVTRADEMGEGFVREWFDEASNRYVGGQDEDTANLDKEADQWDDDLKQENKQAHEDMKSDLKKDVKETREKYGKPHHAGEDLDHELGLDITHAAGSDVDDDEATTTKASRDKDTTEMESEWSTPPRTSSDATTTSAQKSDSSNDISGNSTESANSTDSENKEAQGIKGFGFIDV